MNLEDHTAAAPPGLTPPEGESLRFTEEMKGYVTFVESDTRAASAAGRASALMFHLDIIVPDVTRFLRDPSHRAEARGFLRAGPLGGDRPVEGGSLYLLDAGPRSAFKRMRYHLPFTTPGGEPFTFAGIKGVQNDPGCDLWADTSTLSTSIVRGHVPIDAIEAAEIAATGVLHLHPLDFLRQLGTFSALAPTALGRSAVVARFGKFFLGSLWNVYSARTAEPRPRQGSIWTA